MDEHWLVTGMVSLFWSGFVKGVVDCVYIWCVVDGVFVLSFWRRERRVMVCGIFVGRVQLCAG